LAETLDVAFNVNGRARRLRVRTDARLLDVLRDDLRLTGARDGCGKGECGSCTVILDGRAVDSCLVMAFQADGTTVETIEGLGGTDGLHPLQQSFVDEGAVQCGACIPGMIMAGRAFLDRTPRATPEEVRGALAGNLCRCTGYSKIVSAVARNVGKTKPTRPPAAPEPAAPSYYRPRSLEEALEILVQRPGEVRALAGGTDLLVEAKDGRVDRGALFDLSLVPDLQGIEESDDQVRIGASVTHATIVDSPLVGRWCPSLPLACAGIGGPQIRNRGTLGGNLAKGSPAGDTIPPLLAADAVVHLVSVSDRRAVPVAEFVTGPEETALAPDELILGVSFPKRPGVRGAFLRLAQRQGPSVSKVSIAVGMTFKDGRPDWVRVAYGGVGATAIRARDTEAALMAGGYDALKRAMDAVRNEVRPEDDLRSTREYRQAMCPLLLERAIRKITEG
jgi:carbon-monoxide dehydrogenase small subunit/xanthine dehydrogenase small subunit